MKRKEIVASVDQIRAGIAVAEFLLALDRAGSANSEKEAVTAPSPNPLRPPVAPLARLGS